MRNKLLAPNIDNSNPLIYPNGRIKDNTGSGNGTPVNEFVYGDLHEMKDKLMRLYGIVPNDLPDNESNGFQLIDALRALASKNDFILDLTDSSGILQVPIKLGFMLQKESVLCLSGVNFTAQTKIKGIDNVTYTISILGSFKSGEYVRLIKTSSGITLVRVGDSVSIDAMVGELFYLKKANQSEENAGTIYTKATTPLTNLTAFVKRVIGVDSVNYLATAIRNGLYPKEHFAIVAGLGSSPIKNIGSFSGLNTGMDIGTVLAVSGNITNAVVVGDYSNATAVRCTVSNALSSTNYKVRTDIESLGLFTNDTDSFCPVFKPISTTQFDVAIRENTNVNKNLKFHLETIQY